MPNVNHTGNNDEHHFCRKSGLNQFLCANKKIMAIGNSENKTIKYYKQNVRNGYGPVCV